MSRPLLLPAVIALSLAACSSPAALPAAAAPAAPPVAPAAIAPAEVVPSATPAPPAASSESASATAAGSAIEGNIREGNRPPPALRVCAHPLDGGTPTCIDTAVGATSYRIEVAAGRYVVAGQALDDPGMKFAHAERIRCIRAPCPPDTAIVVEVAAGEGKAGIDLSAGEALPPG
ncbi:hypothetical protein [Thermomonas carbonis]|uniref:Carboxypeptidase regulatory-like domain-containing protein n=1 Tax=Thermomonas carbonis TaxID=1463158 RepID=A0A7G9ST26_9GAMM|nr:hypothetical protein [Thermomonas carbonis]QNN71001.1 hypothetical protein H9L16_05325 [Thermomonas carbonis]GHC03845.1 hypothetical protein GCM10010080_17640 [Thermomonas carbonis]